MSSAKKVAKSNRNNYKKRGLEDTESCEKSQWHDREVRVVKENYYEGLRGFVKTVSKYQTEPTEPEKYRLQVLSAEGGKAGKMMVLDSDDAVIEDPKWAEPARIDLDFRTLKALPSVLTNYCLSGRITNWL